jgi:predicted permease
MTTLINDIKFAFRQMLKNPGFTAVVILIVGLGIGANTAIFNVLNAVMLRPLPVKNPQALRHVNWEGNITPSTNWTSLNPKTIFPYQAYLDFHNHAKGVSEIFAFLDDRLSFFGRDRADMVNGCIVSGNFFRGLGLNALLGQTITPDHDQRDAEPVTVISYAAWQRYFVGDPNVVGESVTLETNNFTIIGVLPQGFEGVVPGKRKDFYVPLSTLPQIRGAYAEENKDWWLSVLVRLAPEAGETQAQASLEALYADTVRTAPSREPQKRAHIILQDASCGILVHQRDLIQSLHMLLGLVAIVLVVSCINLAGLLLARGAQRQHELAVRAALGAERWRLIRQLLTESVLIVMVGAVLGLVLSSWGKTALIHLLLPPGATIDLHSDNRVLGFTLIVSLTIALLAGLLPAFRSTRGSSIAILKDRSVLGVPHLRLGKVLVSVQIGLSLILVVGAGLFARTLINLYRVNPGFDTRNLLVFEVDEYAAGYEGQRAKDFHERFSTSLRSLPGVLSVGSSTFTLLNGQYNSMGFYLPNDSKRYRTRHMNVDQSFLTTMGIPLVLGRDFNPSDFETSKKVVIVNQALVKFAFPNENPINRTIQVYSEKEEHRIIGVCADIRSYDIKKPSEPTIFFPDSGSSSSYKVRTAMNPQSLIPAVRKILAAIDPTIPLSDVKTQTIQLDESIARERCFASLAIALALLAVLLSCIGLYGVMAYNVERRTSEIGIRIALGATSRNVAWPVICSALLMAVVGVAIAIPVVFAILRFVRSYLFGVEPHDPATLSGAIALLLAVAILAAWIPARRAAKVDPMEALRYE